jgi:hypothetical protein
MRWRTAELISTEIGGRPFEPVSYGEQDGGSAALLFMWLGIWCLVLPPALAGLSLVAKNAGWRLPAVKSNSLLQTGISFCSVCQPFMPTLGRAGTNF